ncbi:MAG: hypothetical protein LUG23_05205 [Oscillospiraceae bacterium]|nr:hypothetical protein [Oscillospiraceae bacterium]
MRVGLIGMFCLLLQMVKNFMQHITRREVLIAAVLASICVYWFSYSFTPEMGFMIGMSIAILNNSEHYDGDVEERFAW